MKNIYLEFVERFNKNKSSKPESSQRISKIELEFGISFPEDYRFFLEIFGELWTPNILDLIVEENLDINDVQDFWNIEHIAHDKKTGWTSKMNFIPIASDCMENIFAFKQEDIIVSKKNVPIYFLDHDMESIEKINESFESWIESYTKLIT